MNPPRTEFIAPELFSRALFETVDEQLAFMPAVALLGPRQVGKTLLARAIAAHYLGAISLDLQHATDRAKLTGGSGYFKANRDKLIVLGEVQYVPEIFAELGPEIDVQRTPGRFLLLGSASGKLLRRRSDSLAGRVSYLELTLLQLREVITPADDAISTLRTLQKLWLRGGFPVSFTAPTDALSYTRRTDFISTFLNHDIRELGVNVPTETLHQFWRMTAHSHG